MLQSALRCTCRASFAKLCTGMPIVLQIRGWGAQSTAASHSGTRMATSIAHNEQDEAVCARQKSERPSNHERRCLPVQIFAYERIGNEKQTPIVSTHMVADMSELERAFRSVLSSSAASEKEMVYCDEKLREWRKLESFEQLRDCRSAKVKPRWLAQREQPKKHAREPLTNNDRDSVVIATNQLLVYLRNSGMKPVAGHPHALTRPDGHMVSLRDWVLEHAYAIAGLHTMLIEKPSKLTFICRQLSSHVEAK